MKQSDVVLTPWPLCCGAYTLSNFGYDQSLSNAYTAKLKLEIEDIKRNTYYSAFLLAIVSQEQIIAENVLLSTGFEIVSEGINKGSGRLLKTLIYNHGKLEITWQELQDGPEIAA